MLLQLEPDYFAQYGIVMADPDSPSARTDSCDKLKDEQNDNDPGDLLKMDMKVGGGQQGSSSNGDLGQDVKDPEIKQEPHDSANAEDSKPVSAGDNKQEASALALSCGSCLISGSLTSWPRSPLLLLPC